MMRVTYLTSFGMALWLAAGAAWGQAPSSPPYTKAQAQAGAALYTQNCAMCHGDAVMGRTLLKPGTTPTVGGIFTIMTTNMPLNQPGSLSHEQYEDILAYALQKNGHQASNQPLKYDQALTSAQAFVNKKQ